jgi:hypothetical protein
MIFWVVMSFSVETAYYFRVTYCLLLQGRSVNEEKKRPQPKQAVSLL